MAGQPKRAGPVAPRPDLVNAILHIGHGLLIKPESWTAIRFLRKVEISAFPKPPNHEFINALLFLLENKEIEAARHDGITYVRFAAGGAEDFKAALDRYSAQTGDHFIFY